MKLRDKNRRISWRLRRKKEGHDESCPYNVSEKANLRKGKSGLGFLGLAAEESGDVQIVRGDFAVDVADVLLDLMDYVGQRLLLEHGFFDLAAGFPRLGEELRLLLDGFFVGFLEACGDDRDFNGVFHGIVHDRAEDDVGVFMRGFLDDGRSFVNFVQG